ncbi:MAG TPA: YraN family protein [Candidatus Babeliales bacterium]|nr:YraN family protein [Candidatus Babeliales bacterium]
MITPNKQLGTQGEELVVQFLESKGYTILERNYAKQYGEIDLIASKNDIIAFIEVKTRKQDYFDLEEVILPSKQRKIIAVAKAYLARQKKIIDAIGRFDVALVHGSGSHARINYLENAFGEEQW